MTDNKKKYNVVVKSYPAIARSKRMREVGTVSAGNGGVDHILSSPDGSAVGLSKVIPVNSPKVGYIEPGMILSKDTSWEEIIRRMLYKVEPATFEGKLSIPNDVEIGSARGILTYTAKQNGNGKLEEAYYNNDSGVKVLLNFSEPDVNGEMQASRVLGGYLVKNETYKAYASFAENKDDNLPAVSLTSTISVNVRRKWFAGSASAIPDNSLSVRSLPASAFLMSESFKFSVQRGVKRVIFCYPGSFSLRKLIYDGVISNQSVNLDQLKVSTIDAVYGDNSQAPVAYKCCVIENDIENLQDATDYYTIKLS